MNKYQLFDSVELSEPLPLSEGGVAPAGTHGAVVEVLNGGEAYIVELFGNWVQADTERHFTPTSSEDPQAFMETLAVETVYPQQIRSSNQLPEDLLAVLNDLPAELLAEVQDFAEFLRQKQLSKSLNR